MKKILLAALLLVPLPAVAQITPSCDIGQYLGAGLVYGSNGALVIPTNIGASTTSILCRDKNTGLFVNVATYQSVTQLLYGETDFIAGGDWALFGDQNFRLFLRAARYYVNSAGAPKDLDNARGSFVFLLYYVHGNTGDKGGAISLSRSRFY